MALTVTPTVDTALAAVRLVLDGGTPPYVVDASPVGRDDYRIRSTYSTVTGFPNRRVAVDGEVPLNTATVYVVTDSTGAQASSSEVTVTATDPVLSDAFDPGAAIRPTIVSQKPNTWEARSVWWDVLGAREPFASIAPMRLRSGTLVLRTDGTPARAAMVALLTPGDPLVLRSTCPGAVDDVTILVETVDEALVLEDDPEGPTLWSLRYQAISRDIGPTTGDAGRTYSVAALEYPTYGYVVVHYVDYDAFRLGDPDAGLGPELLTNGNFASGLTGWSTYYTDSAVSWSSPALNARAQANAGASTAYIAAFLSELVDMTVVPGARYRISGRVRRSHANVTPYVTFITATAPAHADYFDPGASINTQPPIAPNLLTWYPFAFDVTVPPGDDRASFYFSADGLQASVSSFVELDDLSVRELT